jgi:hypothetical protein
MFRFRGVKNGKFFLYGLITIFGHDPIKVLHRASFELKNLPLSLKPVLPV